MTIEQFGQSIKAKYPQYKDVPDAELGKSTLTKYPQYQDRVVSSGETQPPQQTTLGKVGGFVKDVAVGIVKPIAQTAVQFPRAFASGVAGTAGTLASAIGGEGSRGAQIGQQLEQKAQQFAKPVQVPILGEIKPLSAVPGERSALSQLGQAAEMGASLVGAKGASSVVKQAGKGAIKSAVIEGALTGAEAGALGGFGTKAQEKGATIGDAAGAALTGGVTGAAIGAPLGLAGGLVGKGVTKALTPTPKIEKLSKEVVRQGIPEADVALIRGGSALDRSKMLKMLDVREKQVLNKRVTERATDVVGNSFVTNIAKPLEKLNKEAGKKLGEVAKGLSGKKVNVIEPLISFSKELDDAGVRIGANNKLNFKNSNFEGLKEPQKLITSVWNRALRVAKKGDALDVHRTKTYIDEIVDYGKQTEGLSGRAQGMLKGLRRGLDGVLDTNFAEYNKVNTVFSDTVSQLDAIGDALGKKFKIGGTFADAQAGLAMRRVLSNTNSRAEILQLLDNAQGVAKKYKIKTGEDIIAQAGFADTLEKMFGSEAPTSFLGQGERFLNQVEGVASPLSELAQGNILKGGIKATKYAIDMTRGIGQKEKAAALRALLMENAKKAGTVFGKVKK